MRYGKYVLVLVVAIAGCQGFCRQDEVCRRDGHGNGGIRNNLPPAPMLMHPGPGVDGPGPGVMMYQPAVPMPAQAAQVAFTGPDGMMVNWDVTAPGMFDSEPLVCPGRYNFPEGAIYRLKLSNLPGRPGVELYPTLEVGPTMPRTAAFLAHNAIPVQLTPEDFDQVLTGNFVTKVVYLPDPEFQELAVAGVETLVSTRLDPGVDPIVEADRRGAILAVLRLGNKDLQLPGSVGPAGGVTPAGYSGPVGPNGVPTGLPGGAVPAYPGTVPQNYIAGVTAPQWGMPMSGTPIGLPGPPHVPLGVPAGLQRYTIANHTKVFLPEPTQHVRVDVKERPPLSYPHPANHARIVESVQRGGPGYHQPFDEKYQRIAGEGTGDPNAPCPKEEPSQNGSEAASQ
jgi:hypothetical protein